MSALQMVRALGVEVALAGEKVKLRGLDRLDHETATHAIEVARAHRDQLWRELAGEGAGLDAPKPRLADLDACPHGKLDPTGLDEWPEHPREGVEGDAFAAYEAAGSLLALCRRHGLRVVLDGGKARIVYPENAPPALVAYGNQLLDEGRNCILSMKNQGDEAPEVTQ